MYLIYPKTKEAMFMLGLTLFCNLLLFRMPLETNNVYVNLTIIANVVVATVMFIYVVVAYILYLIAYYKQNLSGQTENVTMKTGSARKKK